MAFGAGSFGFLDAVVLFFALVNIQLFITDAPWNSGWAGFGLGGIHHKTATTRRRTEVISGGQPVRWTMVPLASTGEKRDRGLISAYERRTSPCPRGFEARPDDPLGLCSERDGVVCWRGSAVLVSCFNSSESNIGNASGVG